MSKEKALADIVKLAKKHHISPQSILQALNTTNLTSIQNAHLPHATPQDLMHNSKMHNNKTIRSEDYIKIFAYLGGIFILSGIILYLGLFWPTMNSYSRVLLTLGTGIALYILALVLPLLNKNYEEFASPLYLTSAFFQPIGLLIAINEFSKGNDFRVTVFFISVVMFLQQMATFISTRKKNILAVSLVFGAVLLATLLDLINPNEKVTEIVLGLTLMVMAYILSKTRFDSLTSFWYFIGAPLFLNGFFEALRGTYLEIFFFIISAFIIYLSTVVRNKTLLFVSTLSTIGYIGYFIYSHFMHSTAWPMLVVLVGLVTFGVGVIVLKLSKKYIQES